MCTLTFVLYCLSEHPDVLAALRQEILTNIGPTRRPTYEDIRQCKYLRAVINGKVLSLLFKYSFHYLTRNRNPTFIPSRVCSHFFIAMMLYLANQSL